MARSARAAASTLLETAADPAHSVPERDRRVYAKAYAGAGPPGPALPVHSKHRSTRASAAAQGDRPTPLAFVKELQKLDTSAKPSARLHFPISSRAASIAGMPARTIFSAVGPTL